MYWVVVNAGEAYPKPMAGQSTETGTLPLDSDAAKIQVSAGANALKSGRVNAKANQDAKFTVSGLEKETAYDLYYVAMDQAGNYSDTVKTLRFNTLDTNAPRPLWNLPNTTATRQTNPWPIRISASCSPKRSRPTPPVRP